MFNALHLVDLVMIGLVLHLPKCMVYYGFSPGFIFSYLSTGQEIGWKERIRYDLYCVKWDVKPQLNQSLCCNKLYRLGWQGGRVPVTAKNDHAAATT